MRYLGYLLLFALIAYGAFPYYYVYRLDLAISKDDKTLLEPLVNLDAIRAHYRQRALANTNASFGTGSTNVVIDWLRQNLQPLGDAALDKAITLEWVRDSLRDATREATNDSHPYLIAGIRFAFFESYNRFLIRIGELGMGATHVRLSFDGREWKVTDVIRCM